MMRRLWFVVGWLLAFGCEEPCKEGFQRYGDTCVRSPTKDASTDSLAGSDSGSAPPAATPDSGADSASPHDAATSSPEDSGAADDAGTPDSLCYLDADGDEVGAGEPRPCSTSSSAEPLVPTPGDCDDGDPSRSPSVSDVCGDGIDNDCDGKVDEESNNACGGPCSTQLRHQPGDSCSNGLLGACQRAGEYECSGTTSVSCITPMAFPSAELCGDNVDNDCDGTVDDPDAASNAPLWYQDCDRDGFSATTVGATRACSKPAEFEGCDWTSVLPQVDTKTNWDCNDSTPAYSPSVVQYSLPPNGMTKFDLNCDGVAQPNPVPPSENPGAQPYFTCPQWLLDSLNAGQVSCANDTQWSDCIAWKREDGKYYPSPAKKCPDTEAFKIFVYIKLATPIGSGPGTWTCLPRAVAEPLWPCR